MSIRLLPLGRIETPAGFGTVLSIRDGVVRFRLFGVSESMTVPLAACKPATERPEPVAE